MNRIMPPDNEAVTADPIRIDGAELEDLDQRLARTRWPDTQTAGDWSQGVPLAYLRELVGYWRNQHDWRRAERLLNGFSPWRTCIDGLDIHFLHVRSSSESAVPLLITHGWPGSVLEFHKVIGPLTDPAAHGADPADAFHVVCPSLPGYGFSGKPNAPGWGGGENRDRLGHADAPARVRALLRAGR